MPRKRVLIVSSADDLHANALAYALKRKGHGCECLFTPDFPTLLAMSMRQDPEDRASRLLMRGHGITEDDQSEPFDTIWLRRQKGAFLPEDMHPGDKEIASYQCESFLASVLAFLDRGPGTFWVNPMSSDPWARQKPYQLRSAVRAGLTIPDTLVSNDPAEIRAFLREQGGVVAHKLLENAAWISGDEEHVFAAYTAPVTAEQLPEDAVVRLCPGIFQPLLQKRFEVRVACLGDFLVALRINSQTNDRAATDWRAGQFNIEMEPYTLPQEVAEGCRRLLKGLGLAYGAIDFVVTPEGEHVFLEVNPQGQFLFLEDRAGLPLLDMFSEFLVAGTREFTWRDDHEVVRFEEFLESRKETWPVEATQHVYPPRPIGVPDMA